MWKRKVTFWRFGASQMDAYARYLERQAEKGWYLDYRDSLTLFYGVHFFKKGEPRKLRYSVVIIPETSEWDDLEDERVVRYREICREYGWELEGKNYRYYIFRNESLEAVPVETDGSVWFDVVSNEAWRTTIPRYGILFLFSLLGTVFSLAHPMPYLFSNEALTGLLAMVILAVAMGWITLWHMRWLLGTKRQVEGGGRPGQISLGRVFTLNVLEEGAWLFWIFVVVNREPASWNVWYLLYIAGLAATVFVTYILGRKFVKKIGVMDEEGNNRIWAVILLAGFLVLGSGYGELIEKVNPGAFRYEEEFFSAADLELPVDLEQLGYHYDPAYHVYHDFSFLAGRQGAYYEKGQGGKDAVIVNYYEAKLSAVRWLIAGNLDLAWGGGNEAAAQEMEKLHGISVERLEYKVKYASEASVQVAYVLKGEQEIMTLEFDGEADEALVEAAAAGMAAKP